MEEMERIGNGEDPNSSFTSNKILYEKMYGRVIKK
jgi:hypothetical protein